jgi:cobalt/nickel transport protein
MSYTLKKTNFVCFAFNLPTFLVYAFVSFFIMLNVHGHFGMIIPSKRFIDKDTGNKIDLDLSLSHPFSYKGMDMGKPLEFGVFLNGKRHSLTDMLKEKEIMGSGGWTSTCTVKRPGVYQFYMVPEPYWEPAEDIYIQHITKVVVPTYGMEKGWFTEIGLKAEIVPLARPFGLYAGNTFQGIVKIDGKISPNIHVEIVYYNKNCKIKTRNPYLKHQYVRTDPNGIFTYTPPAPGWWGFAALTEDKVMKSYQGKNKHIELGAIIWINFEKWNT